MQHSGLSNEFLQELRAIVADIAGVDAARLNPGSDGGPDESWDSLAHLSVVTAVEEKFGVQFTMDEIQRVRSFPALVEALAARLTA